MSGNQEPLKDRRKSVGLTQQRLADLADVKLSLIADVESGRQLLTGANADRVMKALEAVEAEFKHVRVKDILIKARIEAGKSQEEVAKGAEIDPAEYSKWEAGLAEISDQAIFRVHDFIDAADRKKMKPSSPATLGEVMQLKHLLGPMGLVERIADRENAKETDRAASAVSARLLSQEVGLLEAMAAKVPGLEAEIAALKAEPTKKLVSLLSDLVPPKDPQKYAAWVERRKREARNFSQPQARIAELENLLLLFEQIVPSLRKEIEELEKRKKA